MHEEPKQDRGRLTAGGIALMVIGLLILVPSGLCTGVVGFVGIVGAMKTGSWGGVMGFLPEVAVVGGLPIALGVALIRGGWKTRK